MADRYQQFLGSKPGIVVELIDDSSSPYRVRAEDGFEFSVAAEDFKNYYRPEGTPTTRRWGHLVTDPESGLIDSRKMGQVMDLIKVFEGAFPDFGKARNFVRTAVRRMAGVPGVGMDQIRSWLEESGGDPAELNEHALQLLAEAAPDVRGLLVSDSCAEIQLPTASDDEKMAPAPTSGLHPGQAAVAPTPRQKPAARVRSGGMKNVEMSVEGNRLTVTVDLSKDFGPSKSGKTQIVASTEGNKSVPGRDERIGLNVYRQESKKAVKGRRASFKNVEMAVAGDKLTITVDLSKEFGPSKSGKTIIIASTEGNQLVLGREERIGLNIYKKID